MNKDIAIKVQNVSKTFRIPHEKISSVRGAFVNMFDKSGYEEFNALNDVSFEVKKGEFFGILGRNGSGKSTLLKVLAGIYTADKGRVHIDGLISPFLELGIGFNPELSGRDNIYLNATVLGLTEKQINEKFGDIVAFSELERFIDQKVKNYSSGMQVRLAFSVAIHANREILLMDEVLAVGDVNFQQKCLMEFRKYKKQGKTVVLVTHDVDAVRQYCDRAMLLSSGKVITIAKPDEAVYEYSKIMMAAEGTVINAKEPEKKEKEEEKEENKKEEEKEEMKKEDSKKEEAKKEVKPKNKNHYVDINSYNSKGEKVGAFESGEDIIIKISIEIGEVEKDMFVAVGIFDKITDVLICGNNMFLEKFEKNWQKGLNKIDLMFRKNLFNKGDFYITSTLFKGDPKDNKVYDYFNGKEEGKYFRVIPKSRHAGFTQLPHEWK